MLSAVIILPVAEPLPDMSLEMVTSKEVRFVMKRFCKAIINTLMRKDWWINTTYKGYNCKIKWKCIIYKTVL